MTTNWAAESNTHWLFHSFCRSGSGTAWLGPPRVWKRLQSKVSARLCTIIWGPKPKNVLRAHLGCWRNSFPVAVWLKVLTFSSQLLQFLAVWASSAWPRTSSSPAKGACRFLQLPNGRMSHHLCHIHMVKQEACLHSRARDYTRLRTDPRTPTSWCS